MDTSTVITLITKIIIPLCAALITYFLIPWIQERVGVEKYLTLTHWAWRAVEAAEQIFPAGDNESKFEYAVNFIQQQAKKCGIDLTYDEVRALIESIVSALPKTHETE